MKPSILAAVLLCFSSVAFADATPAAKTVSAVGIPYKTDDDSAGPKELLDAIRSRRPNGKLLNLDRMLLHSPNFTKGWNTMFAAIRGQLALPGKLRETAIMAVAVLNKADYEWIQHEPEYLKAGGTKEQLAILKKGVPGAMKSKLFDESEQATLALTTDMTKDIVVKSATMKRIRAVVPDDQLIELIGTISGYNMVSRFLIATGVEAEQ